MIYLACPVPHLPSTNRHRLDEQADDRECGLLCRYRDRPDMFAPSLDDLADRHLAYQNSHAHRHVSGHVRGHVRGHV